MRFIQNLCQDTVSLLQRIAKYSNHPQVRQRAQCILFSFQGFSISKLADLYNVHRDTICHWFNSWESSRFVGLYDRPGRGNKPSLKPCHAGIIRHWVKTFPKNLNKVVMMIKLMLNIEVCKKTLERFIARINFTWRRVRKRVKGKPDPVVYEEKKAQLEVYQQEARDGKIDLCYTDQSGFCLTPPVPYAWQEKDDTIEMPSTNSKQLNVMGFLNPQTNTLTALTTEATFNGQTVIACIDHMCQTISKKTVLVMDQAPFHTCKKVQEKIKAWEEKGLHIFLLPTYSPHLNPIEILWRFMKYEWIEFDAYQGWKTLVQYVEKVIKNYGSKYRINFV